MLLAAQELPEVPRALAVEYVPRDPAARLADSQCDILHIQAAVADPKDRARLTGAGIEWAAATVNDSDEAKEFLAAGATSVLSDYPDLIS